MSEIGREHHYYGLDDKPCSQEEAMRLFSDKYNDQRQVAVSHLDDGVTVSTVHLIINHGWGERDPLIYETMIFGGKHDEYQERYATREEALIGHEKACRLVTRRWSFRRKG